MIENGKINVYDEGKLEICGVFKGYPGMAGMYILKVESREEAKELCDSEPLIVGGYATYTGRQPSWDTILRKNIGAEEL